MLLWQPSSFDLEGITSCTYHLTVVAWICSTSAGRALFLWSSSPLLSRLAWLLVTTVICLVGTEEVWPRIVVWTVQRKQSCTHNQIEWKGPKVDNWSWSEFVEASRYEIHRTVFEIRLSEAKALWRVQNEAFISFPCSCHIKHSRAL